VELAMCRHRTDSGRGLGKMYPALVSIGRRNACMIKQKKKLHTGPNTRRGVFTGAGNPSG